MLNQTTAFAAGDTNVHHVRVAGKASDWLLIQVDGEKNYLTSGVDAAPTLDATMFFTADDASGTNRCNVKIADFFIADEAGIPEVPVILGDGVIHTPALALD